MVDLERSGLAAPLPSFADPDSVWQDPLVRARFATAAPAPRANICRSVASAYGRLSGTATKSARLEMELG